jgi:preprotein translocase subunit SecA
LRQPVFATVDAVIDFAEQFTRLEAENVQLRKTVKSSADQVLEANRLAIDAKKENALLKEELSKLKKQMKDEQDARRATAAAVDKNEGVLRESVKDLLGKVHDTCFSFLIHPLWLLIFPFFQRPLI